MLKLFITILQTGIIAVTLLPPAYGEMIQEQRYLSLNVFWKRKPPVPYAGCFAQLVSGPVVFFSPNDFAKIRQLYSGTISSFEIDVVSYDALTGSHRRLRKLLSNGSGQIKFDGTAFTDDTMNRLRLTPMWERVLTRSWKAGCSILDLRDGTFLITGGEKDPGSNENGPGSTAIVYDASTDNICFQFKMKEVHTRHQSFYLGEGKVLVLGGCDENPGLEILDMKTRTSLVAVHPDDCPNNSAAVLIDRNSILMVGGTKPASRWPVSDISLLDTEKFTVTKIGLIKKRRYFDTEIRGLAGSAEGRIENVLAPIGKETYVFAGGSYIEPHPFADFCDGVLNDAESFVLRQ